MNFRSNNFNDSLDEFDEDDCWFILGHGHAGTHFIYDILNKHYPERILSHQPGWNTFNPGITDPIQSENIIPQSETEKDYITRLKKNGPFTPIVIDPCFRYIQYKAFPDANYMWLHRDGREFVRSSEAHHLDDNRNIGGDDKNVFEWSCERWGIFHERIKMVEEETDIIHLPFKELVNGNCVEELSNIIPNLDDYDTTPKNPTTDEENSRVQLPENWSDEREEYFEKWCGNMMRYLGYD